MKARSIKLKQISLACPEQYDSFYNGEKVGFLYLRHGHFTVEYPDYGGETIYSAYPNGDGAFPDNERKHYLNEAKHAIANRLRKEAKT